MKEGFKLGGIFTLECYDKNGLLKWEDNFHNLVVNEGLQHILDVEFSGTTQVTTWYLGLTDGTPTVAAGDTLASHAGWTEETGYTGNRQEWVEVRTAQTMTNSASVAVFPITGTATIGGGFLASVATGTSGILFSVGALSGGDRSVISGDTVNLTYSLTSSDV
jgi:hypothetical protein